VVILYQSPELIHPSVNLPQTLYTSRDHSGEAHSDGLDIRASLFTVLSATGLSSDNSSFSGNVLITGSSASVVIGGAQNPWTAARVLVPLALGLMGIALFFSTSGPLQKYLLSSPHNFSLESDNH